MKVAIIPARSKSKRIPKKNIRSFVGYPIIKYSIDAAIESKLFDRIIVSTDCEEVKQLALSFGAEVPFLRSEKNSDDHATTMDVLKEVCLALHVSDEKAFESVCCIYPTAPFLTAKTLRASYKEFFDNNYNALLPVTEFEFPVFRSVIVKSDNSLGWLFPEFADARSQDLQKVFHDAGQFYWFKKKFIFEGKNILEGPAGYYFLEPTEVQDIDNESDWKLAELKYSILKNLT